MPNGTTSPGGSCSWQCRVASAIPHGDTGARSCTRSSSCFCPIAVVDAAELSQGVPLVAIVALWRGLADELPVSIAFEGDVTELAKAVAGVVAQSLRIAGGEGAVLAVVLPPLARPRGRRSRLDGWPAPLRPRGLPQNRARAPHRRADGAGGGGRDEREVGGALRAVGGDAGRRLRQGNASRQRDDLHAGDRRDELPDASGHRVSMPGHPAGCNRLSRCLLGGGYRVRMPVHWCFQDLFGMRAGDVESQFVRSLPDSRCIQAPHSRMPPSSPSATTRALSSTTGRAYMLSYSRRIYTLRPGSISAVQGSLETSTTVLTLTGCD
jgi:hypothetical protein